MSGYTNTWLQGAWRHWSVLFGCGGVCIDLNTGKSIPLVTQRQHFLLIILTPIWSLFLIFSLLSFSSGKLITAGSVCGTAHFSSVQTASVTINTSTLRSLHRFHSRFNILLGGCSFLGCKVCKDKSKVKQKQSWFTGGSKNKRWENQDFIAWKLQRIITTRW